ncbi:MAG: glutamate dehydrogenase [Actinomycetota bacterium]|nr:glutamate dehydrogenase [Actinomycetota bacterium]
MSADVRDGLSSGSAKQAGFEGLDEDKATLLARVAAASGDGAAGDAPATAAFLRRYYRHVANDDLIGRRDEDIAAAALSQRELALHRPQGTATVRVWTPTVERDGWSAGGHGVVEVVADDMPFLVDSVTAELTRHGRAIHLVVHPQLVVRRDVTGALLEVLDAPVPTAGSVDGLVESWMHIEIDRGTDAAGDDALAADLQRVLRDVREAVEDWPKTRAQALRLADEITAQPPVGLPAQEVSEAIELLQWLADDHFTFMGYREYLLEADEQADTDGSPHGHERLVAVAGTGLGILRADQAQGTDAGRLPPEVGARAREPRLLVVTKANSRSTVHRPAYLDYIGVKQFDASGQVVGERRFLGLFTSAAYNQSIQRIPVLRRKAAELLARSGFSANSHSGKDLLQILESYPRDELFQISLDDLAATTTGVLHLQERRQLRLFLRRDDYGRYMSCMVYLPRDRYTTQVRQAMEEILLETFDGVSIDYAALVSESVLARLHFVVRVDPAHAVTDVDPAEIEARLVQATRSWDDDFADALADSCGPEEATRLAATYSEAFPEAYKEDLPASAAVADLHRLEALHGEGDIDLALYTPKDAEPGERRLKLFHVGEPVSLSLVLPRLQEMGVEVVDERPYEINRSGGPAAWVYDFGLRYEPAGEGGGEQDRARFQEAFAAVWRGAAESDGFNALVLRAGLDWRQAMVLRAYAKYLRQAGSTFSQSYIEECLSSNVHIARLLLRLFEARFDPGRAAAGDEVVEGLLEEINGALDAVESLDQDRILRSFLGAVRATLRTNYFQPDADGSPKSYLSLKLDPRLVPDLPKPLPRFEIWVYSPRMEGVHLRFGAVARGGLRWSDRREDFRTEVLGLVKAQTVKNAVIVPVGAKGGFVVKRPPAPTGDALTDREATLAEGIACYRTFISGMLDITDNLVNVDGKSVTSPPRQVVRHDGDDSYLVVAADKGTATFSDIANQVALDYGFWLGDAFASGGSVGYDHKAMGITARGAWESVKRHFRELELNTQTEPFTVVGIGDMSGDVFGNGMLLSEHIRLVAAFDHRHVFLDPDPDAATSYAERRRLFELPRSSWADYDPALISAGGGVYPRSAKSIPLSAQVKERLGLPSSVRSLSPPELLRAILQAPVDLLWNGGIGTYVKSSSESHADVGDKANDSIRVNGAELRARVVGEGGNLGFTQLGRIEFALAGGHINTDAIDNSAGVDTSDHEVNIKILLDQIAREGELDTDARNALLAEMTDDVARLVLADNYEQNVLLGNGRRQARDMLSVHKRFIKSLEERGDLDRALEFLPSNSAIDQRQSAGLGLTSSELAVLAAYSKITLTATILDSPLPDEPWFGMALRRYFPDPLVEKFDDRLSRHPLRREIITTWISNDLVNRGGSTFVFRAMEETGASALQVARAYTVVREIFRLDDLWAAIDALDNKLPTDVQSTLYLEGRRLLDRSTRWVLQGRQASLNVAAEVEHFQADIDALVPRIPELLVGAEQKRLRTRAAEFAELGVPEDLALRTAGLLDSFSLLDVVEIAAADKRPAEEVAPVYFAISERIEVDRMLTRITALPRGDRWTALARSALRYDLYAALAGLTTNVLTSTSSTDSPAERIEAWEEANREGVTRAQSTLEEIITSDTFDLATLSVALRTIRTLLR